MKKVNWLHMSQKRIFRLFPDGQIKYFKTNNQQRGTIILSKGDRVVKTGRQKFEIVQPTRTWFLEESSPGTIDQWFQNVKQIIESIK